MPLVLADRVRDTTTTTGTGTVTLSGTAPTGYQSFAVIGNGNTTYYTINAGSQWEVGIGTYSSTGPTLARNTVLESSNSNALVDFAAGTKDVFVTYPADEAVYQDGATIAAGTAVLGVANGGTGVTTSTGTGSVVLSNSPTLVTPILGAASATSIANGLGAVGTPSYTFTGDLNTGIYSPAADTLAFVEGGVEAMRITSAGNVGIGTSTPGAKLEVQGTDGVSSIIVRDSAATNIFDVVPIASNGALVRVFDNAGVSRVQFTAYATSYFNAGNVGIGTTSPGSALTVARGAGSGAEIAIQANGNSAAAQFVLSQDSGSATYLYNRANQFMSFGTNNTERMRITAAGDVGIGTSSPASRLDVVGGTDTLRVTNTDATAFSGVSFYDNVGTRAQIWAGGSSYASFGGAGSLNYSANSGPHVWYTNYAERMRITSAGNVGIGTTSPTRLLSVAGTANAYMDFSASSFRRYTIGSESVGFALFDDTAATYRMVVNSSGNVGIGTTAPNKLLTLMSPTNDVEVLRINAPGGSGGVQGRADIGFGFFDTVAEANAAVGFEEFGTSSAGGSLLFKTRPDGAALETRPTERMRIDSSGRVGVATTAPDTTFEVALSTSGFPGLRASRSGAQTQYIQMDIGQGASARLFATGGNKAMFITNNNTGAALGTATDSTFIQVPGPTANTPITAMYLESSTANVGIGTTAPAGRVHAVNTYTNSSDATIIAGGNIPGINLRASGGGRFSILANFGATNTTSLAAATGTSNPAEVMRIDHASGAFIIGTGAPNAAAQLQVDSVLRGFLPPRMTTVQRDAITTPPDGLMLYNTTTNKLQVRAAGAWVDLH